MCKSVLDQSFELFFSACESSGRVLPAKMIFGFNTDVKQGDTVYHVQTEAHPSTHTFQSTIFVKGQCMGKKTGSYSDAQDEQQTEQQLHELLKDQHRHVVEAIRNGQIDDLLKAIAAAQSSADFL